MRRNFDEWLATMRSSISSYDYYVDFNKVYNNLDSIKIELNILNSLIGSKRIEQDFIELTDRYPEVLKCIPILIAVREYEIYAIDENGGYKYDFKNKNYDSSQFCYFMQETGLFDLISNRIINNLFDYVTGVEVGLSSNGRKNRGGHLMEDLVEEHIKKLGLKYYKEMTAKEIEKRWNIDMSSVSNNGKTTKRFDFVVISKSNRVYAFETNFYASGGSKLNETARSYKMITTEAKDIPNFSFVWITDGKGWVSARNNLKETFDVLDHLYNVNELESDVLKYQIV